MSMNSVEQPVEINQIMQPDEMESIGFHSMTSEQQLSLFKWGMKMRSISQPSVQPIKRVKYEGRLVVLEDGSRWEIDSNDVYSTEGWKEQHKALVMDGAIYNLDEMEKAGAEAEEI